MIQRKRSDVRVHSVFVGLGTIVFCCLMCGNATAQRRTQRDYQPARATLSPYLGLLQTNVGPVPNYFSIVRPQLAQQAFNRQVQASSRVQSLKIQNLSDEATNRIPVSRTGKAGGFLNYSHYFPATNAPPPRR